MATVIVMDEINSVLQAFINQLTAIITTNAGVNDWHEMAIDWIAIYYWATVRLALEGHETYINKCTCRFVVRSGRVSGPPSESSLDFFQRLKGH